MRVKTPAKISLTTKIIFYISLKKHKDVSPIMKLG